MSALLASDAAAVFHHVFIYVFISNSGFRITDSQLVKGFVEAEVGHDGGYHCVGQQLRKGGGFKRNDSLLDFEYGIPLINTEKDFCEINDILKKNNTLLIIKIHPKQDIDTIGYPK